MASLNNGSFYIGMRTLMSVHGDLYIDINTEISVQRYQYRTMVSGMPFFQVIRLSPCISGVR